MFLFIIAQNLLYVDLTFSNDDPSNLAFKTLTSALAHVTSSMTSATIVLMPNQQIVDLSGTYIVSKPLNIT